MSLFKFLTLIIGFNLCMFSMKAFGSDSLWSVNVGYRYQEDEIKLGVDRDRLDSMIDAALPGYQDGYVLPDNTGNIGGRTGNYGYQSADQLTARPGFLRFTEILGGDYSSGSQTTSIDVEWDGIYLGFNRRLEESSKWSLDFKFSYSDLDLSQNRLVLIPTRGLFHFHDLGGVIPPPPPYSGQFVQVPGSTRIFFDSVTEPFAGGPAVALSQSTEIQVQQLEFMAGINYEWEMIPARIYLLLGAGLNFQFSNTELEWRETLTQGATVLDRYQQSTTTQDLDVDYYLGLSARLKLNETWGFEIGVDHLQELDSNLLSDSPAIGLEKSEWAYRVGLVRVF